MCKRVFFVCLLVGWFTCHGLGYHKIDFINDVIKGGQVFDFTEWKAEWKWHSRLGERILLRIFPND